MSYDLLKHHDIIIEGDFKLKSGEKTDYYVDIKQTISNPELFNTIIDILYNKINQIPNVTSYSIMGVPYAGIPFASVIGYKLNIPQLMLRKEKKMYGRKKMIEGNSKNKNLILIEDVMTTGKSILETIDSLNKHEYNVKYVFTIFQRGVLNYNNFFDKNIQYNYLISRKLKLHEKLLEITPYNNMYATMNQLSLKKKTNLILSADITDIEKFKKTIIECGEHIFALKIHLDIFPETEREDIRNFIIKQKKEDNFLIIEDRKFSDICKTNIQQMKALKIKTYADIVICHGVAGFEFIKHCSLPVLVVAQLSCKNNLINTEYTKQCVFEASKNKNIIGFISQENLGYNKCIYCKPGIRLDKIKDDYDQTYTGITDGIDFYIVGRGITNFKNQNEMTKYYKETLWKSVS
jgi:uridine monophosphate synthetase